MNDLHKDLVINKLWRRILTLILVLVSILFLSVQIDLSSADLGRHIMNGKISIENLHIIDTNYYSYTEPDYPTANHHWGIGVIYYFIHQFLGFEGLSIFNILLFVLLVVLLLNLAVRQSNFTIAYFLTLSTVPLLASRCEVRPEMMSFLFMGITYTLLSLFQTDKLDKKYLYFLPLILFFWVNIHLFFALGLYLIGVFLLHSLVFRVSTKTNEYIKILIISILVCLLNPSTYMGLLEPFVIFKEYGYKVAENQSVLFMQNRFPATLLYIHFELLLGLSLFTLLFACIKIPLFFSKNFYNLVLLFSFGLLGMKVVRTIPLFGILFIPIFANTLYQNLSNTNTNRIPAWGRFFLSVSILFLIAHFSLKDHYISAIKTNTGIGLRKNSNASAAFFKENNIQGKIFNNYDIGGYLIYHLYPTEKVFVDNRPEAYSVSFFKNSYEPILADENVWKKYDSIYRFNAIFFNRNDNTTHGQPFLIRRIADEAWVPVYVDEYALILVKNDSTNRDIIHRKALPKSMFISVKQ